jgi:putative DNA methylase
MFAASADVPGDESSAAWNYKALIAKIGERAIEDGFPFEDISDIAEVESWRKEIYRPIYHIHKWWAQRLGSVFRAAIIGAATPGGSSIMDLFYQPIRLQNLVVFDPFMGSGTTIGEAHKLGCCAIGRDINPVAYRTVKTALGPMDRGDIDGCFKKLETIVAQKIQNLYRSTDSAGEPCDVLYYFWVKTIPCSKCGETVDLFSRFIFAKNAYVNRDPMAHVICPYCDTVFECMHNLKEVSCDKCKAKFNPQQGWAKRTTAVCRHCGYEFPIAKTARDANHPPAHRMYAKLVLRKNGKKEYLRITQQDLDGFNAAKEHLKFLNPPLPKIEIQEGYNTHQILNYGYRYWHELFNERQLLALSMLSQSIKELPESNSRDALAILFSGVLEFNNMFASYKGEGTGAVRHMFSHHILKPERMPIEANIWGTERSSGAFSTLYKSRLMKALDYRESPFELSVEHSGKQKRGKKIFSLSGTIGRAILNSYPKDGLKSGDIYLSCGSSTQTDIPDCSVDLVITDPPFFNNVNYSELADFFYVWQQLYFNNGFTSENSTTRHQDEVQDSDAISFANKLCRVYQECYRVLKNEGLLVFSYHHSQENGWSSVARAIFRSGFSLVQSQPVKSEMSVAAPKSLASEPIDLDVLLVCKKRFNDHRKHLAKEQVLIQSERNAREKVSRFNSTGRILSRNDVLVVLLSQMLVELSAGREEEECLSEFNQLAPKIKILIEQIYSHQSIETPGEYGQTRLENWINAP